MYCSVELKSCPQLCESTFPLHLLCAGLINLRALEESVLSGVARCAMQQCMLRERSDRGRFLPIDKKASSCRGAYRVPLLNSSVCVCQCVTFVVFTEIESCTRPIFINPGSVEAGECGLTRGTCFAARRLELVAVAGRL